MLSRQNPSHFRPKSKPQTTSAAAAADERRRVSVDDDRPTTSRKARPPCRAQRSAQLAGRPPPPPEDVHDDARLLRSDFRTRAPHAPCPWHINWFFIGPCCKLIIGNNMIRLLWHRRDLRINDNELYHAGAHKIYSVFVFDPSDYALRPTGISDADGGQLLSINHGPHFTRALLDAVQSLRCNLKRLGGNLIVRTGDPVEIIPKLAQSLRVEEVAWCEIPGYFEYTQSENLKKIFLGGGPYRCKVRTTCSSLVHPNDLPKDEFTWKRLSRPKEKQKKRKPKSEADASAESSSHDFCSAVAHISPSRFIGMPAIMGDFRRAARPHAGNVDPHSERDETFRIAPVRALYSKPNPIHIAQDFPDLDMQDIPSLEELTQPLLDTNIPLLGCIPMKLIHKLIRSSSDMQKKNLNVEEHCMQHIQKFVKDNAASAKRSLCDVSNSDSSKLSTPLALGVLSPQQVYRCVKEHQSQQPETLDWLISHLEMRDFFLFDSFRSGRNAYRLHPRLPSHKPNSFRKWLPLSDNKDKFTQWASGQTGLPLVDAGVNELVSTGYISNRVRQNMASVLTKDLHLDWRLGAEFFQLCLEDHCVAANFGNWIYFAGVGGDPKNRHFRTISQALRYDPDGRYVRKWIASLKDCTEDSLEEVLRPWAFRKDWPSPIVPPETQLTWQDREWLERSGRLRPKSHDE
ncbi:hypothetical protein ACHAWF_016937 [Thalassiosira exigua]